MISSSFFQNKFIKSKDNILILNEEDNYTKNFSKQWKKYQKIQIDSMNNFNISENYLKNLLFTDLEFLKNKNVLELGSGAGRFTEHIVKYAKNCVTVDLSSAIYYNIAKNKKNVTFIKADYLYLEPSTKFDIVICRGVLQHTPNPQKYLLKLFDFVNKKGHVFFDIYPKPKLGLLHPKYLLWRPLIQKIYTYDDFEKFLTVNISKLLKIKRFIKKIFFNSNLISDLFIPVWDYKNQLPLNTKQLEDWAILDTLDGIYANFDKPYKYSEVVKILKYENIKIINSNNKRNYFKCSK